MKKYLKKIYFYKTENFEKNDLIRLKISNMLSALGTLSSIIYSITYILGGSILGFFVSILFAFLYLIYFYLISKEKINQAIISFLVVTISHIFFTSFFLTPNETGGHYYFILLPPVTYLLLKEQKKLNFIISFIGFTLLLICNFYDGYISELTPTMINVMYIINLSVIFIVSTLLFNFYLKEITQKEKELENSNSKLQEQKNLIETFINSIPDIVWMKDTNSVYLHCNKRFTEFFGASKKEIVGKTDYDFVDKKLADFFILNDKVAMNANKPMTNYETISFADDGHEEYTQTIKTVIKDNNGNIVGTLGVGRNFTKEKEQKDELEKSKKTLSEYVIYSRTNPYDIITEVSEAFCKICGYAKEELIGERHSILRHSDMPKELYEEMWKTIKSKKVWSGEIKNRKKDGTYYWININISPEYDIHNDFIGYISISTDITAKKDFELQHEQLLEQSKMASLGEMIGNIAHQWRQPLNAISLSASSLNIQYETNTLDKKTFNETTSKIIDQSKYLSDTIDTFKNFIKSDKEKTNISIQSEVSKTVSIIESTLKTNFITLNINMPQTDIVLHTVKGALPQVLINILSNSKDILIEKKTKNPFIELKVLKKDKITISIEDNAGGIKKDIMPHIFEPYFTTKHQSVGTGLGLYMSYKIVTESLNGKLYVKNTYKGAKFIIELENELIIS